MDAMRKGSKVEFDLDEDTAKGLYSLLAGHPEWVTPEQYAKAQYVYQWFFVSIQELATDYQKAVAVRRAG